MKKRLSIALAAIMIMLMGMDVNAANSISTTTTVSTPSTTTAQGAVLGAQRTLGNITVGNQIVMDGKPVTDIITIGAVTQDVATEAANQAQSQLTSGAALLDIVDVTCKTKDFKSITIPFSVKGVKAGDNIIVMHKKSDGTWEQIKPDKVEDGVVTVTFTSLSPVAFIHVGSAANGNGAAATKTAAKGVLGASRSPKTYDWFPVISALALVSILGTVYCKKRLDAEEKAATN